MLREISEHISWKEAVKSQVAERYGKKNEPDERELQAMRLVAERVFEPVRRWLGKPIVVSSFFRAKQVNVLAGGAERSQHCKGEAIDMDTDTDNRRIFDYIRKNLDFDKLIWEFGDDKEPAWVHVSYKATGNRRQVERARKVGYRTVYEKMV